MIITDALARRLEYAEAVDAAGCVDAACVLDQACGASAMAIAGGVLTFCGPESPLTHAIGIGMHGTVTAEEISEIEHYFQSRGATVAIDVCPHSDPSLRELLAERSYRAGEYNNVLVRALPAEGLADTPDIPVRSAAPEDEELYARTIVCGFFSRDYMTEPEFRLGRMLYHMPCTTGLLASVSGQVAGGGGLSIRNKVASFFGDATLAAFRGRGVQRAIITERLRMASAAACDIAVAGTQPGSTSQRNYQRLGFEVAYTKTTMLK